MKAIWNIIRSILALLVLVIFFTFLVITPLVLSVTTLVTNRTTIVNWLSTSGVYSQASDLLVQRVVDELKDAKIPSKELNIIKPKIQSALSEDFVKKTSLSLVSGVYDWLEGKTKNIAFSPTEIDFQSFAKDLIPAEQLKNKDFAKLINALKPCTPAQIAEYEKTGGFKSVQALCIPPSLNLISVEGQNETKAKEQIIKLDNIFQTPDIPIETASTVLLVYKLITYAELIAFGLLALLCSLFILVAPTRFFKIYLIGTLLFIVSLVQFFIWKSTQLLSYLSGLVLDNVDMGDLMVDKGTLSNVLSVVLGDIAKHALQYSLWVLIFSVLMLITTGIIHYFVNKKAMLAPSTTPIVGNEPPKALSK